MTIQETPVSIYSAAYQTIGLDPSKPKDLAEIIRLSQLSNTEPKELLVRAERVKKGLEKDGEEE